MFFQTLEDRFKKLYEEYLPMVRAVLYNMTGETYLDDLIQETFVKVWRGLPRFDFKSSVKTWVYRVTVNTAIDHLRKAPFSRNSVPLTEDSASLLDESQEIKEREAQVQKALMSLDEHHRSVVTLFYFENLKVEEISKVLDVPVGTVKSRLSTARKNLRDQLMKLGVSI